MGLPIRSADVSATAFHDEAHVFYEAILDVLLQNNIPFMVGGALALREFTGVVRDTKDLDLFLQIKDQEQAMATIASAGFAVERTAPHWITKARQGSHYVDFIYGLANGIAQVDDDWFARAPEGTILGRRVLLMPAEEMLWSKAFIMERDRFDGADIHHLIRSLGPDLNWRRLLTLFGPHWRVLLAHLILYGFVYPSERSRIPEGILESLVMRLAADETSSEPAPRVCRGTLFSRTQYVKDLAEDKFEDARLRPIGNLTPEEIAQ